MCDPVTGLALLGGALSLGSSLLAPKPASPPPIPATAADPARDAGATVHVGDGQTDNTTKDASNANLISTPETRVFGRPIGGLGKSGLSI